MDSEPYRMQRPAKKPRPVYTMEALEAENHALRIELMEARRCNSHLCDELQEQRRKLSLAGLGWLIIIFGVGIVLGSALMDGIFFQ
jgi:hypothetical protein